MVVTTPTPAGSAPPARSRKKQLTQAERDRKLARARLLDCHIGEVARSRRRDDAKLAYLLWRFEDEGCPEMLEYADVGIYAVERGHLPSERVAHDLIKVAKGVQEFELLRTMFITGEGEYSKILRVLPGLTRENEEKRADQVRTLRCRELEALRRDELGLAPVVRRTYSFSEEDHSFVEQRVQAEMKAAKARGETLTPGQALARICQGSLLESAASNKAPPYRIVIHACECGEKAWRQTREGPVPVSPQTVKAALPDALIADTREGPAKVPSEIPPAVRAYVYDRDQGRCRAPGCKNMGYLHVHHEPGRKVVGHDPDHMLLACTSHHPARHEGKIRIEGRDSTGFRWFLHDGTEILEPPPAQAVVPALPERVPELDARIALAGLTKLRMGKKEAGALLARARAELLRRGETATPEALLEEALRLKT